MVIIFQSGLSRKLVIKNGMSNCLKRKGGDMSEKDLKVISKAGNSDVRIETIYRVLYSSGRNSHRLIKKK